MEMKSVDYKAEKLLRLDVSLDQDQIKAIKITGDFFIHPEEGIELIEHNLINQRIIKDEISESLKTILEENKIKIIGFNPEDLEKALLTLV